MIQEHQRSLACTTNLNTTHVLRIDAEPAMSNPTDHLQKQLEKFCHLETLGIQKTKFTTESKFMEEINFNRKHYEVKLPFREDHPLIPDNHTSSVRRLSSLISRLKTNTNLLRESV